MIVRGLALALLISVWPVAGQALALYEAEVPVSGQQDRERNRALRAAFEQVLVKVTGRRDTAGNAAVEAALRQPMGYVQQFFYLPLTDDPEAAAGLREAGHTEMLSVRFDENAVNRLLQQAGVPQWGRTRPVTLLWLAVEDRGERWLLGGEGQPGTRQVIEDGARSRGLPVLFPLMDLEDRRQLHYTDVWGNFQDAILAASARYRPGAVLVGRLWRDDGDGWQVRWSLYHDGNVDHWQGTSNDRDDMLVLGADGAADRLATRHARVISLTDRNRVEVVVTGIGGVAAYERTLRYLGGLDPVSQVQVVQIDADRVRFRLDLDDDRAGLVRIIELGSTLAPVPGASGADARELSYRLLP